MSTVDETLIADRPCWPSGPSFGIYIYIQQCLEDRGVEEALRCARNHDFNTTKRV